MKYFTIEELTRSDIAVLRRIDNTPNHETVLALTTLVDAVLDKIRERWGRPIRVNSGYRSDALNAAVGGSKTSQHRFGQAADITTGSVAENAKLFALIIELQAKGEITFDQLIDECNYAWIHVSYRTDGKNRRQILHL